MFTDKSSCLFFGSFRLCGFLCRQKGGQKTEQKMTPQSEQKTLKSRQMEVQHLDVFCILRIMKKLKNIQVHKAINAIVELQKRKRKKIKLFQKKKKKKCS